MTEITSEVSAQRKSQGVYEAIRDDIVSLRLAPGSMIYENELVEELGVSRTPIREAIRLLVSEGLLEVLPQRGTRIARISVRKVTEARFIREQLELGAFRLAARLWDLGEHGGVKAEAERLLEKQWAAAEAGDAPLFLQLDEAFHQAVIGVTNNATLLQMIYQMRGHLNRLRCLALRQYHYMPQMIEEHLGLLEAVEQGDEALVTERLELHLGKLDVELPELRSAYPDYFQE
ncbi:MULTISPECIES: GntR family transcriptional regulator [Paenibacillus]|uniref:GntR family transcriptional regulator n=1 Tax=Paenibacillus TaxID=44249 RepID=UPI0022B88FA1|nr:GntR family transcriptional regulator [Paenibacillus caseinilyticus]MCZ8523950.1 GntR family transcriptional regulator [Paenibacillus caseinilyticus]